MQYDYEKKYQKRKEWIRGILIKEDAEKIQTIVSSERMMIKFWSLFWHSWIELVYEEIWKHRCKDMELWEKKEKISKKEKYMSKEKRKKGPRKGTLKEKTSCRVDENIESRDMSLKIALDSINREVKKGTIVSWN